MSSINGAGNGADQVQLGADHLSPSTGAKAPSQADKSKSNRVSFIKYLWTKISSFFASFSASSQGKTKQRKVTPQKDPSTTDSVKTGLFKKNVRQQNKGGKKVTFAEDVKDSDGKKPTPPGDYYGAPVRSFEDFLKMTQNTKFEIEGMTPDMCLQSSELPDTVGGLGDYWCSMLRAEKGDYFIRSSLDGLNKTGVIYVCTSEGEYVTYRLKKTEDGKIHIFAGTDIGRKNVLVESTADFQTLQKAIEDICGTQLTRVKKPQINNEYLDYEALYQARFHKKTGPQANKTAHEKLLPEGKFSEVYGKKKKEKIPDDKSELNTLINRAQVILDTFRELGLESKLHSQDAFGKYELEFKGLARFAFTYIFNLENVVDIKKELPDETKKEIKKQAVRFHPDKSENTEDIFKFFIGLLRVLGVTFGSDVR